MVEFDPAPSVLRNRMLLCSKSGISIRQILQERKMQGYYIKRASGDVSVRICLLAERLRAMQIVREYPFANRQLTGSLVWHRQGKRGIVLQLYRCAYTV
jgi:hypothetical protein